MNDGYKKDYVVSGVGLALFVLCPILALLAIWFEDSRWGWTAFVCVCVGIFCFAISIGLDGLYRKRGLRK